MPAGTQSAGSPSPSSQPTSWKDILYNPSIKITPQLIEWMLTNAPDIEIPMEVISPVQIKPKAVSSVAVSGVAGLAGALYLYHKFASSLKYILTTQEVMSADEKSPLLTAKHALFGLRTMKPELQIVVLSPTDYQKIKNLLTAGGVYISGLPTELIIAISQVAGFGRLYHYSPIQKKFLIF